MTLPDLHDHRCQVCGRFGSHGFGPPGFDATIRWYCGVHQGITAPLDAAEMPLMPGTRTPPPPLTEWGLVVAYADAQLVAHRCFKGAMSHED